MLKIGVVGAGHVGLVTGACFAQCGHLVYCADNDAEKIAGLNRSVLPFYEPGLDRLVKEEVAAGRLFFTTDVGEVARKAEVIFIAVGTPSTPEGKADLSYVEQVTMAIAHALKDLGARRKRHEPYRLIVEKSTVPVLTGAWVRRTLNLLTPTGIHFDIAANPEFLREGSAIKDFMEPDRIIIGCESAKAEKIFRRIYASIKAPLVFTDVKSAELIKHASNSFLALKISYINAIAQICERVGADVEQVAAGMGYDDRIGHSFLDAGVGWGGSCFPKDVAAFISLAEDIGYPFGLLKEVDLINRRQRLLVIQKARKLLWNLKGKQIGILGLAFKPDTDDIRESPALDIIRTFLDEGADIKCYDPKGAENMRKVFPNISYEPDPYAVAEGSHLLILLTRWREFRKLDFRKLARLMKSPLCIDGRNFLDALEMARCGFTCLRIGKPTVSAP